MDAEAKIRRKVFSPTCASKQSERRENQLPDIGEPAECTGGILLKFQGKVHAGIRIKLRRRGRGGWLNYPFLTHYTKFMVCT